MLAMKIAEVCCDGLLLSLSANFLTLTPAGYKLNIFGDAVLRLGQHPHPSYTTRPLLFNHVQLAAVQG